MAEQVDAAVVMTISRKADRRSGDERKGKTFQPRKADMCVTGTKRFRTETFTEM